MYHFIIALRLHGIRKLITGRRNLVNGETRCIDNYLLDYSYLDSSCDLLKIQRETKSTQAKISKIILGKIGGGVEKKYFCETLKILLSEGNTEKERMVSRSIRPALLKTDV